MGPIGTLRHGNGNDRIYGFHQYPDRRFKISGGVLDTGFHPVRMFDPDNAAFVVNPDEECSSESIGKSDNLPSEILAQRTLELDRLSLSERDQMHQFFFCHQRRPFQQPPGQ